MSDFYQAGGVEPGRDDATAPSGTSAGKRTLTDGLAPSRAAPGATAAPSAAPAEQGCAETEAVFGLHLIGDDASGSGSGAIGPAQAAPALRDANVRTVQATLARTGHAVANTGQWDAATVAALTAYQAARRVGGNGVLDAATLGALVADLVGANQLDFALGLIADFFQLASPDLIALRVNHLAPGGGAAATDSTLSWENGLRVIAVYWDVVPQVARVQATLGFQLAVPAPAVVAVPVPAVLAPADAQAAVADLRGQLREPRALRVLQGAVGATSSGVADVETVQRLAAWQGAGTGRLDDASVERLVMTELVAQRLHDSAIRLVIAYHGVADHAALVGVYYDGMLNLYDRQAEALALSLDFDPNSPLQRPGPTVLHVGPKAFRSYAALVQNLVHESEHIRHNRDGVQRDVVREFEAEVAEMLAAPIEDVTNLFLDDGHRAFDNWNLLTPAEQRDRWPSFEQIRDKLRDAYGTLTPAERIARPAGARTTCQALRAAYNAERRPPPP